MNDTETFTDEKLGNMGEKYKAAELVKEKRGAAKKIAERSNRSKGHISLVFAGKRIPSATVRRAASEVLRIPQKDLLFPLDGAA